MNHEPNARIINLFNWLDRRRPTDGRWRHVATRGGLALTVAMIAGILITATPAARASLMAYEGFNYATGGGNLTGQNGGFGWSGGWQGVNNGASDVQATSLSAGANAPSGYDSLSTGKSVLTPNNTRTGRFLDT